MQSTMDHCHGDIDHATNISYSPITPQRLFELILGCRRFEFDVEITLRGIRLGGYLLAIVFDEIPERTIVWSANRDDLAERGSRAQISANAGLELRSPSGRRIWGASLGGSDVAYGAMLDSGNFVLAGHNSAVHWQSFDMPTDTLLPGQVLNQDRSLFASFSETNHSTGRFIFIMQSDGNLVFYTINYPMRDHVDAYWAANTVGIGFQVIFNQSGYVYLSASNGTILNSNEVSARQFYQRLPMEYDGVLRQYVHPKSANSTDGSSMSWSVRAFEPPNICVVTKRNLAGGSCGLNSLCIAL